MEDECTARLVEVTSWANMDPVHEIVLENRTTSAKHIVVTLNL